MYIIFVASQNENMKLAKKIESELVAQNEEVLLVDLVGLNLPIYTPKEQNRGIPEIINEYVSKMSDCSGYVFVAPEYNYTTPAVLNSFISWLSVVGDDFRAVFTDKTTLVATHSGGGGHDVLNAMRNQFTRLGSVVIPREVLTSYQVKLNDESLTKTIIQLIKYS